MPSAAVPWSVGMVPIRGCIFVGSAWLWGSNEDLPLSDLARSQLLVSDCESVSLCEPSLAGCWCSVPSVPQDDKPSGIVTSETYYL